jgi:cytochrome c oxidase subunit IV
MSQNAVESHIPAKEHGHAHGIGHVVPLRILVGVFGALVFLTVVTVAASEVNFGEFNLIVALAIAVIKASLVVLFFMHLIWDKPFNAIVFVGCLVFVGLFISLALLDTTQYHNSVFVQEAPGMKEYRGKPEQFLGREAPGPSIPGSLP